jgi:pimeloyl-ACP methyl ester carboxylesterase
MFAGFLEQFISVSGACLRVRTGGKGPPVLLLHGHPRTHVSWSRVAPILAERFFVVCPDLRGFGKSSKPIDMPEHAGSSKRAKTMDCIELMRHLGHERFSVAGHDRGSYVALRAALDHPGEHDGTLRHHVAQEDAQKVERRHGGIGSHAGVGRQLTDRDPGGVRAVCVTGVKNLRVGKSLRFRREITALHEDEHATIAVPNPVPCPRIPANLQPPCSLRA